MEEEEEILFCFFGGVMSPGQVLRLQAREPEAANFVHCPPVAADPNFLTESRGSGPNTQPRGAAVVDSYCGGCGTAYLQCLRYFLESGKMVDFFFSRHVSTTD